MKDNKKERGKKKISPFDFYMEGERVIFTEEFHIRRGSCCGNGCRHCPFEPKHIKGTTTIKK